MRRLFVDTSAWFAYVNRKDPDHRAVQAQLRMFEGRLATSNFIFDECVSLCRYRLGHDAAVRVGEALLQPWKPRRGLQRGTPTPQRTALHGAAAGR